MKVLIYYNKKITFFPNHGNIVEHALKEESYEACKMWITCCSDFIGSLGHVMGLCTNNTSNRSIRRLSQAETHKRDLFLSQHQCFISNKKAKGIR